MLSPSFSYILRFLLAVVFLISAAWFSVYTYQLKSGAVFQGVKDGDALFVFHIMTTSCLLFALVIFLGLGYMIIENSCKYILGKVPSGGFVKKFLQWLLYGVVGSLVIAVSGPPIFNIFWHDYFRDHGYSSCPNTILNPTSELFNSVWVRNKALCEDPEISMILRDRGYAETGVAKANEYIEQAYSGPSPNNETPRPPLRGSERTD